MATARRGLLKGRQPPSPQCTGAHHSSITKRFHNSPLNKPIPRRRSLSNDGYRARDEIGSESEGFDETDKCTSSFTTLEDGSYLSSDTSLLSPRTQCGPKCAPECRKSHSEEHQRSKLYPNLGKFKDDEDPIRSHHNGPTPAILIAMVLLLICSIVGFGHLFMWVEETRFGAQKTPPLDQVFNQIKSGLKVLRSETEQSQKFWVQVLAQLELLKEESPQHPAVLLGLVPLDSQNTAVCLSDHIVKMVSDAFGDTKAIAFDTQSSILGDAAFLKEELDQTLQGLNISHAAAIYNVEKIVPDAAMIFHAYCDTENAPFKRALILLTLGIDHYYSSQLIENSDSTAQDRLMSLWTTKMREEDAAAVVSRIANAPIVFRPEKKKVIHRLCPY